MKIVVYGSLRKGAYNYNRMKMFGDIEYIKTTTLEGWDLYSLGPYPGIKQGNGTIVVDLLEVDNTVYNYILAMEQGAGYKEETVIIEDEDYKIYVYQGNVWTEAIPTGDWLNQNKVCATSVEH